MNVVNCTVESIEALTSVVHKVILKPASPIEFKAGQYCQVVMGEKDKRPFSIANAPQDSSIIELHIGAEPSNAYAYEVLEKCRNLGELNVEVAHGDAYLRESTLPAIVVAGGTGYSYAKSIVLNCLATQPDRELVLYWGAKNPDDLYESKELSALAVTHQNFSFKPVVENPDESWQEHVGWVHKAVLNDVHNFADYQVYTAGRFEMSATIRDEFSAAGLLTNNLFGDAFAFI
jgi:aquacobalamin reductase/NAD(P)H-flavin reductase